MSNVSKKLVALTYDSEGKDFHGNLVAYLQKEGSEYDRGLIHIYWDEKWNLIAVANDDHSWWLIEDERRGVLRLEPWEWNANSDPRYAQWLPPKNRR